MRTAPYPYGGPAGFFYFIIKANIVDFSIGNNCYRIIQVYH